jgi:SAM-dependent methyltransferase
MSLDSTGQDFGVLNEESRAIWDQNAGYWDDYMGDAGNDFHRELVAPSAERLLALQPGETVLEIACGAGLFARQMAEAGAQVIATDFSAVFLERAKERTKTVADQVEFRRIDATNEAELLSLGERRFDAVVSNMALMDMPTIEPLFRALSRLLKVGGRFVFTVMHPAFNGNGCTRVIEETDSGGEIALTHAMKITRYLTVEAVKGIGIRGQPVSQYYFHRPFHVLLDVGFRAGFVLDGLEEPAFQRESANPRALNVGNFRELPLVLAARMRLL